MNDPLHDQVPHMVPHSPDWPVGRYERVLLIGCAAIGLCSVVGLLLQWSAP
jgi:hypothetical protein